jgi:hypothetical protein
MTMPSGDPYWGTGITIPDRADLEDLRDAASEQLDHQQQRAQVFQDYYDGEVDVLALMDTEERRAFRQFLAESGANWCELIVNAVAERMQVVGFSFGNQEDNELAWAVWQANGMDADAEMVQTEALITGSGFVLVQPEDNAVGVSINPESVQEVTVLYEPGNRRRRLAGYKRFHQTEILMTADVIATWDHGGEPDIATNPAGLVGLIQITPQPRILGLPRSELTPALVIQDRINTTIFNRLVSGDYGAFRQIWASGMKMARQVIRDEDGGGEQVKPVRPFDIGANRLLINENPEGKFGAFPGENLRGYLDSIEQDVTQLAAITQTPPHYLLGQMVNMSADAIKAAEAGLVAKTRRRALHIGEGWEEVERTALGMIGSPAAANISAEVIWGDFETRSTAQLTDSLVKMRTLGVPLEVLWRRYGASPQEVEQWKVLAAAEAAAATAVVSEPGATA